MGSQRAANEIWTAEPRLRDLREGGVVRHAKLMQGDARTRAHTYMKESTGEHTCLRTRSYIHTKGLVYPHAHYDNFPDTCRATVVTHTHRQSEAEDREAVLRLGFVSSLAEA